MSNRTNSHAEDDFPLMKSGYTAKGSPSTSGQPSRTIQQVKGDFATNGIQPSLALELDISTIEHVILVLLENIFVIDNVV